MEEIRRLAYSIIDAYEARIKPVGKLMGQTYEMVRDLRLEQENMIMDLREALAKGECLRKKDFDTMMEGIRTHRRESEKEVAQMLEKFRGEEDEVVALLRRIVADGKSANAEDLVNLKADILVRQRAREKKVAGILKEFHLEQEELTTGLRKLLSKGESVKIRDFRALVKAVEIHYKDRKTEVSKILEELGRVREGVSTQWQRVMAVETGV